MRLAAVLGCAALIGVTGCGKQSSVESTSSPVPTIGSNADGTVTRALSTITLSTGEQNQSRLLNFLISRAFADANGNVNVSTQVGASISFNLNSSLFTVPASPTPFVINDFGFLQVGGLQDNNLNLCGPSGHKHCGTALIRIYTTGTAGAGLWNAVDAYGAPISSAQAGVTPQLNVGLDQTGAAVVQQITVPPNKHTVLLSDFTNPKYDVSVDFRNAGAGSYATTLVLEYALSD